MPLMLIESPYGALYRDRITHVSINRKPLRGNATCTLCAICLIMGGLPDGERVMFFMCDTRNLTIYNHLDQEGRRITICPVGALS